MAVSNDEWCFYCCQDLKRAIIDEGLKVIVDNVIIPHSGWDPQRGYQGNPNAARDVYWSTVFRNASGVLR